MTLGPSGIDQPSPLERFFRLGTSGLSLDAVMPSLCLDVLGGFDAVGGMILTVEDDLTLAAVSRFGLPDSAHPGSTRAHILEESAISAALRGEISWSTTQDIPWLEMDSTQHVVLLPLLVRGSVAALALFVLEKTGEDETDGFWPVLAQGLALLLLREHNPLDDRENSRLPKTPVLTKRQLDILTLVAGGLTNREVARRLFIGQSTVGHELVMVCRAFGVNTRHAAVREAYLQGLLAEKPPGFSESSRVSGVEAGEADPTGNVR